MPTTPKPAGEPSREIGKLCLGGDWACAHGDFEALGDVARRLASYAHEPIHCELLELSDLCRTDLDEAMAAWVKIRDRVRASGMGGDARRARGTAPAPTVPTKRPKPDN